MALFTDFHKCLTYGQMDRLTDLWHDPLITVIRAFIVEGALIGSNLVVMME